MAFADLVMAKDGSLIALLYEDTGVSLVKITQSGSLISISEGSHLVNPHSIAIEHDGRILVTADNFLERIDPVSGAQSVLTAFPTSAGGLAVRRTARSSSGRWRRVDPAKLVRVDPVSLAKTTVSIGGFLSNNAGSGMAMENGTFLVVARTVSMPAVWCGSTRSPAPRTS